MKVIRKKTFEVSWVVPESEEEKQEIKKIIREVESERGDFDPSEWRGVDNRNGNNH